MSRRFENIAVAVLIAGTVLACIAIAYQVSEQDERYYAGRSRPDQELAASPVAPLKNRRPAADRSICRESETEKEYELCQTWRASEAAQDAASVALWQAVISIGGLLGLLWTVIYTARAARAAAKAAETAERSIELQQGLEGPVLHVSELITDKKMVHDLHVRIRNSGKTPAVLLMTSLECKFGNFEWPQTPQYPTLRERDREIVPTSQESVIYSFVGDDGLCPVFHENARAVVWGCVVYTTVFGQTRRFGFGRETLPFNRLMQAVLGDPNGRVSIYWREAGGDAYNYDREEKG